MKILGLDIATTTGWCIADGTNYQTGKFNPGKCSTDGERFSLFRQWLYAFIRANGIEAVAIERYLSTNVSREQIDPITGRKARKTITNQRTTAVLYGLNAVAQEVCETLSIPTELVEVNVWRTRFVGFRPSAGNGKAEVQRVCSSMGIEFKGPDAADAVGIAYWLQVEKRQERLTKAAGPLFSEAS